MHQCRVNHDYSDATQWPSKIETHKDFKANLALRESKTIFTRSLNRKKQPPDQITNCSSDQSPWKMSSTQWGSQLQLFSCFFDIKSRNIALDQTQQNSYAIVQHDQDCQARIMHKLLLAKIISFSFFMMLQKTVTAIALTREH